MINLLLLTFCEQKECNTISHDSSYFYIRAFAGALRNLSVSGLGRDARVWVIASEVLTLRFLRLRTRFSQERDGRFLAIAIKILTRMFLGW